MSLPTLARQSHRVLAIAFTLGFIANSVAILVNGGAQPPSWFYILALAPLFLLLFSGLYLFALPYLRRNRAKA